MSRLAVAARLARRDLARARGRTLLTVAMVALPVMAVTAADVLLRTVDQPRESSALAELGPAAEALVRELPGSSGPVQQDASGQAYGYGGEGAQAPELTDRRVLEVLPAGSRLASIERGIAQIQLPDGPGRARTALADAGDPLLRGRYSVTRGRLPSAPEEIAVAPKLVAAGLDVGDRTTGASGRELTVVGVLPAADRLAPALLALPGAVELAADDVTEPRVWLVDSPEPVTWQDVQELNQRGAVVTSRAVLRDPPPSTALDAGSGGTGRFEAVVYALVAAMAVLQVVLLAGPAFAVGARRQRRALAQLTAAGGRPADVRWVVLLGSALLGVLSAAVGIGLGVGVAVLSRAAIRALDSSASLVVPVCELVVIFAAAVASSLLAALAPARAAARAHPVAVLTERPDPPHPSRLPVVLALILLGVGLLASADAARSGDEASVALSAVPTVLGAVLLAPLALLLAGRVAGALPFAFRYAVRDAARQRARTAPAVGAIVAVVAGATALGIGASSDEAQTRGEAANSSRSGVATVSAPPLPPALWERVAEAVRAAAPAAQVQELRGVRDDERVELCLATAPMDDGCFLLGGYGGSYGTSLLVGAFGLDALDGLLPDSSRSSAQDVLEAGGVVALTSQDPRFDELVVRTGGQSVTVPALAVQVPENAAPVRAVLSEDLAQSLRLEAQTTVVTVSGQLDRQQRSAIADAVDLRAPEADFIVPGEEVSSSARGTNIALLLLGAVAGVLVLGGVLTSTLLALSDARPQFATLRAVGAGSRARRLVAAGYAGTIGVLGATLGVLAGLVPGIAVAHPLTRSGDPDPGGLLPQYLDIPWLLLGALVIAVPLVAAAVAALSARGELPTRRRSAMA